MHYYTETEWRAETKPHLREGGGGRASRKTRRGCTISAALPRPPVASTLCRAGRGCEDTNTEDRRADLLPQGLTSTLQPEEEGMHDNNKGEER